MEVIFTLYEQLTKIITVVIFAAQYLTDKICAHQQGWAYRVLHDQQNIYDKTSKIIYKHNNVFFTPHTHTHTQTHTEGM